MKKGIAIISTVLILSNQTTINVYAEDTDLKTLASSLGAETDCLNIVNYAHSEYNENLEDYLQTHLNKCNNYEALLTAGLYFYQSVSHGSCLGISTLEVF